MRHQFCDGTELKNVVAEHMNITFSDKAQSMISHSYVSKDFLAEAINKACHSINRFLSIAIFIKTLFEI